MVDKIGESFKLLFANPGLYAALVLTVWVPCNLLINLHEYHLADPENFMSSFRVSTGVASVFGALLAGAIVYATVKLKLGERPSYGECISAGFRFWGRMFFAWAISGICVLLGLVLLLIPGLYLMARFALIDAVVVIEEIKPSASLGRSGELTKGHIWEIILLGFIFGMVALGSSIVVYVPAGFHESLDNLYYCTVADTLVDLVTIFASIALVLFYLDLKDQERVAEEARAARLEAARQRRLEKEAQSTQEPAGGDTDRESSHQQTEPGNEFPA